MLNRNVYTNLPTTSFDFEIVGDVLREHFDMQLYHGDKLETYINGGNVYFRMQNSQNSPTGTVTAALNALYQALRNLDIAKEGLN